jgi:channel protein (hemolysin III family)
MPGFYQPFASWTHLLAALLTLSTGYILLRKGWGNRLRIASIVVFMICFVFMFSMSGIYHALEPGFGRQIFRRLDYAAIYTMIAGTATPIHVIFFRGWWRWGILTYLWLVAIVGLLLTIMLIDNMPEWFTLTIFGTMGWSAIISMFYAWKLYGFRRISLAFYGALAYSVGALIDFLRIDGPFPEFIGHHDIFHLFVVLGAAMHWKLIYNWAEQPTQRKLVFMVREKSEFEYIAKAVGENIHICATSRQDLRRRVKEQLNLRFHPCLVPQKVRFRYYKDSVINLD